MKITLSESDAARLGCPRTLTYDEEGITGRDLMELEEQVGWSADQLDRAMQGVPAVNAIGGPLYEMDGDSPKLDPMGKPIRVMTMATKTVMVMVWLCVRRANPAVKWDEFDFHLASAEFGDGEPVGKAHSPTNTTTTKPRSRRSSASARGTSGKS